MSRLHKFDSFKEQNAKNESSKYDQNLSKDLIDAIRNEDIEEVYALLDAGADLSYNRWQPLKIASEIGNLDVLQSLYSEIDEGELSETDGQDLIQHCVYKRLPTETEIFVKQRVAELLLEDN